MTDKELEGKTENKLFFFQMPSSKCTLVSSVLYVTVFAKIWIYYSGLWDALEKKK